MVTCKRLLCGWPQGFPDIASAPEITLEIVKQNPLYPGIAEVEVGFGHLPRPCFNPAPQTRGLTGRTGPGRWSPCRRCSPPGRTLQRWQGGQRTPGLRRSKRLLLSRHQQGCRLWSQQQASIRCTDALHCCVAILRDPACAMCDDSNMQCLSVLCLMLSSRRGSPSRAGRHLLQRQRRNLRRRYKRKSRDWRLRRPPVLRCAPAGLCDAQRLQQSGTTYCEGTCAGAAGTGPGAQHRGTAARSQSATHFGGPPAHL